MTTANEKEVKNEQQELSHKLEQTFEDEINNKSTRITGVMLQYYVACKTELWYFANHINYNDEDENIRLGKIIHEDSYKNKKKNIQIDDTISIDYIKSDSQGIIIHEIKKSSRLEEPVRKQALYYLWYLKKMKGISASAIVTYPRERKKEKISLSQNDENYIEKALIEIKETISQKQPPYPVKKNYCRGCSYFNFCWC